MSKIEQALKKAEKHRRSEAPANNCEKDKQAEQLIPSVSKLPSRSSHGGDILLETEPLVVQNEMLVSLLKEKSIVAEEYDKLRSTIIALTQGEKFYNTLLVTSCASEEGKSLTALNLAISLAREQDHTVLLVDTDLRRPSLHRYLGIEPEVGLVHCLRDGLPLEKAMIKTGLGKLVILPAGEALRDPLDLISSKQMRGIIMELKERYAERYVIFDTPPALPFADAGVLAGMVDALLFVVREGKARREDIQRTLEDFKAHKLLGVVFNDAKSLVKAQSYYYY